jgi:LacI family transcriptional regulator
MASILRLPGWASAFRSAGLPLADDLLLRTPYSREDARGASAAALAGDDPPTALSTVETMTLGAVDAITAAGLRIPDEVSLVTFADLPWSTLVQPPLAAVAQPVYRLGTTATKLLLGRLVGDDRPPQTVVLKTSFVLRGSTGQCRWLPSKRDGRRDWRGVPKSQCPRSCPRPTPLPHPPA